jgi:hypothetical protein
VEVAATGGKKINTVQIARGRPPIIRKSLLLPNLDLDLSDQEAINGSAIASITLPKIIIIPRIVKTPKKV